MKELADQIRALKAERQATILAHNYQLGEVQDVADFVGDSLELSQRAARVESEVIVFCGVDFMAETAAILCPDKTVILPVAHASCPMANMITADQLRARKAELPGVPVVCYVNSTAEVKAESDICCTSANGVKMVASLDADEVLFVPDQYLGQFVATQVDKKMIFWPGYCPTHARITSQDIARLRREFPAAVVMVHPECRPDVIESADTALSTGGMLRFARETDAKQVIVGTEVGMIYRLRQENPDKQFIPVSEQAVCPNMKAITLDKVLWALEDMTLVITVPEAVRVRALGAVERMLALGR